MRSNKNSADLGSLNFSSSKESIEVGIEAQVKKRKMTMSIYDGKPSKKTKGGGKTLIVY